MTPQALALADTDWHLPEVYDFPGQMDAASSAGIKRSIVQLMC